MVDAEFVETLVQLETKGIDALGDMRQVLKDNGGMKRLLSIAMLGLGVKPKRAVPGLLEPKIKTRLPDGFPAEHEKQAAIVFWERKRRPDLVARIEEEAEKFTSYHLSNGTRSENWGASWKTWYSQALEFNKPPRSDLFVASVNPIQQQRISVAEWVARLETFYGDTDMPAGTWNLTWGGKPPGAASDPVPANCACPTQAFALYLDRKKRRA